MKPCDLEALGFRFQGGGAWKYYRDFVIDAVTSLEGGWHLEIRAGSFATRVCGRVETLDELETFLRVLQRGGQEREWCADLPLEDLS